MCTHFADLDNFNSENPQLSTRSQGNSLSPSFNTSDSDLLLMTDDSTFDAFLQKLNDEEPGINIMDVPVLNNKSLLDMGSTIPDTAGYDSAEVANIVGTNSADLGLVFEGTLTDDIAFLLSHPLAQ